MYGEEPPRRRWSSEKWGRQMARLIRFYCLWQSHSHERLRERANLALYMLCPISESINFWWFTPSPHHLAPEGANLTLTCY